MAVEWWQGKESKDKEVDKNGKKLGKIFEKEGWGILNGYVKGDEKGECTFIESRGVETVIDCVINSEMRGRVEGMRIGRRVDSDVLPPIVVVIAE